MCDDYRKSFGDDSIKLVNLKEVSEEQWSTYIGRKNSHYNLPQSIFANPYSTKEYERETAVRLYELHLFKKLLSNEEFYDSFSELKGETLSCWCLPELCHGEVLCNAVIADSNNELLEHIESRFETLQATLFLYTDEKNEVKELLEGLSENPFN